MSPALSLLPALLLAATAAAAEPECPTKCGDVDIPYPFGIGAGCSRSKGFEISCINNGTTAALRSATHTIPVTSLSVAPLPEARVMLPVAYKCYSSAGYPVKNSDGHLDLSAHGVYRISDARNMFVVLGCNTGAFTMNSGADGDGGRYHYQYYMGCFTYCSGPGSPRDGCCHVDIPPGLTDNAVYFENWPHNGMEHSPCDIAFLVDKDGYEFRASDLRMDVSRSSMPVWLDWAIREDDDALSCAAAKGSAGYACVGVNSECIDSLNGPGYFCRCKQGFEGNPYKDEDGCTDYSEVIKSRAVGPEEELVARDQQSPHELEQGILGADGAQDVRRKPLEDGDHRIPLIVVGGVPGGDGLPPAAGLEMHLHQ